MKNSTILLMIVLICVCWIGIFRFSGMAVVHLEEPYTYAGRTILLERVNADSVIISVDGEKDFFTVGDTKKIGGIEISVSEIVYFPEKEDRRAELHLSSLTVCSDGKCELGEDSENCCTDCGCPANYKCEDNECVYRPEDQCQTDADCDDLNMSTKDFCYGEPKTCKHQVTECYSDATCDDGDPCTKDWCSFNECMHKPISGCVPPKETKQVTTEENQEGFLIRFFKKLFGIFS